MPICPKCQSSVPDGMRFCLECGNALDVAVFSEMSAPLADPAVDASVAGSTPLAPTPQAARPRPSPLSTVALKISPSPVISPRGDMLVDYPRRTLGPENEQVD